MQSNPPSSLPDSANPGQQSQRIQQPSIRLDSNENPFGPSPKAVAAIERGLTGSNRYPDHNARELQRKLADHHSLDPEQVLIGAGSTDLIGIIARSLLGPGLNAVTSQCSFVVYSLATSSARGNLLKVPMRASALHLDAIAMAVTAQTRIIFLANPNNPTGTMFDAGASDEFLARIPETVTVVLDQAYFEYAQDFAARRRVTYSHAVQYVREGRNVVVLRTFSKVHGLAGLRIGYALGPAKLLAAFATHRSTYSISAPAQAAAIAAMDDEEHIQHALENNRAQSERMMKALSQLGYSLVPTWANFLFCEVGADAQEFAKQMQQQGVIVRPLLAWDAPTALRITVGTPEENERFLTAFEVVAAAQRRGKSH